MSEEIVKLNPPQQLSVLNNAKSEVDLHGRGTGKSFIMGWEMSEIVKRMPRSITSITGRTYGQIFTRTLPSTLKCLETLGYIKDLDYKVCGTPPKWFKTPFEKVTRYDNFISFSNGTGFLLLSQEREGSSRGPNLDREIADEALTLNKERYDKEISPANRGNEDKFGFLSPSPIKKHHGFRFVSSMPYTSEQMWLLKYGEYYLTEAGIPLFDIWNRIVKYQIQLIEAHKAQNVSLFRDIWNEIIRLKKQITPFVSKDGLLFTLANAFDNIENLGMSYITQQYNKQSLLSFMVEILNWIMDKVEDCYYPLDSLSHIYYDAYNEDYIRALGMDTNWDPEVLSAHDSRMDLDCDPNLPLELVPDWGAKINLLSVGQERNYNFVTHRIEKTDCIIKEFFIKPQESQNVPVDDLVDMFSLYYQHHQNRNLLFFRDRYGDHRQPNVKNSLPYNEQVIARLQKQNWKVQSCVHKGMEPPQHEKYLLWQNILKGQNPLFPKVIFNGKNCKYTIISMNNTRVVEKNGRFTKNKSSETSKTVLPEEATHFSDAVDKRIWTKYGQLISGRSLDSFVSPRI